MSEDPRKKTTLKELPFGAVFIVSDSAFNTAVGRPRIFRRVDQSSMLGGHTAVDTESGLPTSIALDAQVVRIGERKRGVYHFYGGILGSATSAWVTTHAARYSSSLAPTPSQPPQEFPRSFEPDFGEGDLWRGEAGRTTHTQTMPCKTNCAAVVHPENDDGSDFLAQAIGMVGSALFVGGFIFALWLYFSGKLF